MKDTAIGGYFELADTEPGKSFPHADGILLNTARNALEYILLHTPGVKGIYLPYYTCSVIIDSLRKLHIPYAFYHINKRFEIDDDIGLKEGEYLIANNYFGLKDAYMLLLAEKYGKNLIIDNAQAFFARPIPGIKTIYSCRKFVGVCDGGVAYGVDSLDAHSLESEPSWEHADHLTIRKEQGAEAGFKAFQRDEEALDNQPVRQMSDFTKNTLVNIDYERVKHIRRDNFTYLHERLRECNLLDIPELDSFSCPMVYPFVAQDEQDLRKKLINNKVFVAKYWPNLRPLSSHEAEYDLATRLIPIPCDQRYGKENMSRIIEIIRSGC